MSLLNNLLSSIDPAAAPQLSASVSRQAPSAGVPKPAARPAVGANVAPQAGLKRKADGQPDGGQVKLPRKDAPIRPTGAVRPAPTPDMTKAKSSAPANAIPYRGTAGIGGSISTKPPATASKKPSVASTANVPMKAAISAPKPSVPVPKASSAPVIGTAPRPAKKGYAAMLQQAKEREQTKAPAPLVRHEPTKILTKKEREALRAAAKGKGSAVNGQKSAGNPQKPVDVKPKPQEKGKPIGYQGTARPAKKPVEIGYKGTAKPSSNASDPTGKAGSVSATKFKPKQQQKRFDGYANWSDLDDEDDGGEEDYESEEDLSDMEGGMWDMEQEEQLALKAARKEDAEALAEETELKRQKEERKRKLAAMAKAAAGRKRY